MKNFYYILFLLLPTLVFVGCSDETIFHEGDEQVILSYSVSLDDETDSRVIGDGSKVDTLLVGIFQEGVLLTQQGFKLNEQKADISLQLIKDQTYQLVFWGQNQNNKAYSFENDCITVDYSNYIEGGFSKMEEMDAFYAIKEVTVETKSIKEPETIKLSRPFAQLNFADNTTKPIQGTHKAVVTFHKIPKSFNPFTGEISFTDPEDDTDDVSFIFKDFPLEETLNTNNDTYYYVASNYLFAPTPDFATVTVTLELQDKNGNSINRHEFKDNNAITIQANKKTNVLGNIIQQPEKWSVWDGTIPTESSISIDAENRYIIDEAADIAWLSKKGSTLKQNSTFLLTVNIDMGEKDNLNEIQLPIGSTFNGGNHTIKRIKLNNAIFGDATNLKMKNLIVEEAKVKNESSTKTHVGILVNTLKGSSSFSNVTVKNSSASTTNGAAGGMVGYIVRISKEEDYRSEKLLVSFINCQLEKVTAEGSESEGKFVGLLCGYDNQEVLTFDKNCSVDSITKIKDYSSPYIKENQSTWITDIIEAKYDNWLGTETYRRGIVKFNNIRIVPKWDGETTVTPLLANPTYDGENISTGNNKYVVYSPFDLAGIRKITDKPEAIYFKENVDMNGQGKDCKYAVPELFTSSANISDDDNNFKPFYSIPYLDGNNYTIYNLGINIIHDGYNGAALIGIASGTTTHKNLKFDGANIRNIHNPQYESGHSLAGNAYVGTLVGTVDSGTYTAENIEVKNGFLFGVCKIGGIIGRTMYATNISMNACSVNNYYIENYDPGVKDDGGFVVYGEVGGLVGFIRNSGTITNCSVTNTKLNCMHYTGAGAILPGRHVNNFIGDIRTPYKETITITSCQIENNEYLRDKDEHQTYVYGKRTLFGLPIPLSRTNKTKCPFIGMAYYVWTSETIGTVIVDSEKVFYGT